MLIQSIVQRRTVLKSLNMVSLFEGLQSTIRNVYCATAAPVAVGLSGLGGIYRGLGAYENGDDLIDSANIIRGASNLVCNMPPDDVAPALEGGLPNGQCVDTIYQVSSDAVINGNPPVFAGSNSGPGPIFREKGPNSPDGELDVLRDANGSFLSGGGTTAPGGTFNLVNISIVPLNGPDNCGGQDPDAPPFNPTDWTSTNTVMYDDDNGNPTSVDVDLVFGPAGGDGGGGFSVPFSLDFGNGLDLFGDINLTTGDITIGFGNSSGEGIEPTTPKELDPSVDPQQAGLVVVGVRVLSVVDVDATDATEIFQSGGNPNIWAPRLGHISFLYPTPEGTAWGVDIPVKNTDQIIWSVRPALAVAGTPNLGTSFTIRPLVVEACPDSC